jgi:membrane glycosyltransferase
MDELTRSLQPLALPPEHPLSMPEQSLWSRPDRHASPASSPRSIAWRRALVFGAAIGLTGEAAYEMYLVLNASGPTFLGLALMALFLALFGWIALAFVSALAGFATTARREEALLRDIPAAPTSLSSRTALLAPCHNESPPHLIARLQATAQSLIDLGLGARFDLFLLSDTTNPDIWIDEEAAFLELRGRIGGEMCVFYRHRTRNTGRKAGNIADWVRRWGGAYAHMAILDADSVMTGATLARLAAAMEHHKEIGLIQTLPILVDGETLFARLQQFAGRLYGPLIARGIAFWHGAEGNYWGHNAIIRTRAFAENAGLPILRGPFPLGGHVLSHDFVEAALIRRGGWSVHLVPSLAGSYEEGPPTLADLAVRDRRWCQGNLQHAGVLPARGLHWISRIHLLMGIGCYITAPLWLLFLVLGVLISLQASLIPPNYFPDAHRLFPRWPIVDPVRSMWVFAIMMSLLLTPKLMALATVMTNRDERRGFGGAARASVSVLIEAVVAGLMAPITMLSQSVDVVRILLGHDSGWQAQRRADGSIRSGEIARHYLMHTVVGLVLGLAALLVSPALALWMSPVVLGLVLSIPLVLLTSARGPAWALRAFGLLRLPEDATPPDALATARRLLRAITPVPPTDGLRRLLSDAALMRAHLALLPPSRKPRADPLDPALVMARARIDEALSEEDALAALTSAEKHAVMGDAHVLTMLAGLGRGGAEIGQYRDSAA